MRPHNLKLRLATAIALVSVMGSCSGLPKGSEFSRIADQPITQRDPNAARTMQEAVNFFAEKPVTILKTGQNDVFSIQINPGQQVPNVDVGKINASPMEFGSLLNQVSAQAGMSWRITGEGANKLMTKPVYFVQRSQSTLKTVLDGLAQVTNSFYTVTGDRIDFSATKLFVANVPRMANSQDLFVKGITTLGATKIFKDPLSGTVTFRADRSAYRGILRFIRSLQDGRDMIVYDFWIVDRSLSDAGALGVKISGTSQGSSNPSLSIDGSSAISNILNGGGDSGLISGNLGHLSIQATAQFIRSLGDTRTVSRPTISMLSGGKSSFQSGEKSQYIKSVTSTNSTTNSTSSSGTDVQDLSTGVKINVAGAYNSGVISTDFKIDISDLIAFQTFDTGSVKLSLPKTSERKLNAHLEARPGDVMVLGGIIRDSQQISSNELAGTKIPTSRGKNANKTETIILVRPRLVQIRPAQGSQDPYPMTVDSGVGDIPGANPINGVMTDEQKIKALLLKDGVQPPSGN